MNPPRYNPPGSQRLTIGVFFGFRALMVLLVCNYHIWQQGWLPQYFEVLGILLNVDFITRSSYLLVDGLILMSGLLLYLPYALESARGIPVPGMGRFYQNRLVRIVPSYLLSVLVMLFFVALPQGKYASPEAVSKDILTHLTFTFTFWKETYLYTPLNGALWTVAVEMQFYLIFPFLARAAQKKPVLTLLSMALAGIGYRALVYTSIPDNAILINQMVGFLDVYALGILGAMLYVRWREGDGERRSLFAKPLPQALAVAVFLAAFYGLGALMRVQSTQSLLGVEALRLSQLLVRLPFALCMLAAMLGAALMPRFVQKLLDNRLTRFLAAISFNLYIWHQPLSAQIARDWFPDTLHSQPPLQRAYTVLCLAFSLVVAMAATYGVERPLTELSHQLIKYRRNLHERPQTPKAEPPIDPLFLRAEERGAGVD
jgi:peptidoglycan/LPS O-acetylase OafA/YrhL